jgi:hypothetical protein
VRALAAVAGATAAAVVVVGALALISGDSDGGGDRPAAAGRPATSAERALVRRAQALVDLRPRDLGFRLVVRGARGVVRGQTDTQRRTITLYVDADDAPHRVAHDLAHELGHAYDARRMTAAARRAWLRARGAPDAPWSPAGGRASDYDSGAGDFAEVFARCHAASPEFRSRLAPRPADACSLLPAGARTDALARG